jgi:RND family efflux transporter MFP subunit
LKIVEVRQLNFSSSAVKLIPVMIAVLVLGACEEEKTAVVEPTVRPVRAIKVNDTAEFSRRRFSGRARGSQELDLGFKVSGQLTELKVNVGDQLKKDDLIAQLDHDTYKADVDRAKASLRRANATLKNAQEQVRRDEQLYKKGHIAKARLDRVVAKQEEAAADVAAAQASLNRSSLDLKYTNLKAPFTGVVVQTYVENFENVLSKQPVVRIVDSAQVEMVVDIPESLITLVPRATNIFVVFDTFPDIEISATVKEVGSEASAATRTYPVTLSMDQPEGAQILPGMAGQAYGKVDPNSEAKQFRLIEIPTTALFTDDDGKDSYVWIVDENSMQVRRRKVVPAVLTDRGMQIAEGVKVGDWVVTAGTHYLKEAQKIRILKQ